MTVPMTASAAVCTHSTLISGSAKVDSSSYEHVFAYKIDVDGDGEEETVTDECIVLVEEYAEANVCPCGKYYELIPNGETWTVTTHSKAGNIYHDNPMEY